MGNRAVLTWGNRHNYQTRPGIYLHWNGGRDSVEAFLKYCELREFRADSYGFARLTQIISNFFGGGLCIGVDICANLDCDNWDNGVYLLKGLKIVDRLFLNHGEQKEYDLRVMLKSIDSKMPENERMSNFDIDLDTVDLEPKEEEDAKLD